MKKGLLLITLAGIFWGTASLFVVFFAPYGFDSGQMTAMRLFCALLLMLLYCLIFKREALKLRAWADILLLLLSGLGLLGTGAFYYEAMQRTTASTAVVLMYISPVPIMLISVLCLGEKFNLKKGISVLFMLVGGALVAGIIGGFKSDTVGVIMGLLSAASFTGYNIFCKLSSRRGIDPFTSTLYTFLFAFIFSLFISSPAELPSLIMQKPLSLIAMAVLQSLITCFLPYLLYSVSMRYIPVGVAASMSIVEPLTGALIGFIAYRDPLTLPSVIGIILICSSVVLLGMSEHSKPRENVTE